MPTFCMAVSSLLLMLFLGLIAFQAWPEGVLVIRALVVLVMILQFIVYGTHRCVMSALHVCRAGAVVMASVV